MFSLKNILKIFCCAAASAAVFSLYGCNFTLPVIQEAFVDGAQAYSKALFPDVLSTDSGYEAVIPAETSSGRLLSSDYNSLSYFIPSLSEDEAENFDALYNGIRDFRQTIYLPVPVSQQEADDLMTLISNECPDLIQLDSSWNEHSDILGHVVSISPSYCMDKTEAQREASSINALLAQWYSDWNSLSDFEIELNIYNYIIQNCVYSTESSCCQSPYGALIDGAAKCDGRAKAFIWALRSFGIKASMLTGSNHAWALVHIGSYDYNADPTFDDNEAGTSQLMSIYTHFNVPASAIFEELYPLDDYFQRHQVAPATRWDANYHVMTGRFIVSGADARPMFMKQLEDAYKNKSGCINIRFENNNDYSAVCSLYNSWLQDFINTHSTDCSLKSYNCSKDNVLALEISFS